MNQIQNELAHFGVLGMRWGKHKRETSDGTLTDSGKKKVSAEYKKRSIAGDKELAKNYQDMYVDSYNKAANKMNNGGIEKFNASQQKKYGKNYTERDGYMDDYEKVVGKELSKFMNKSLLDLRESNPNYKKADALVQKYNMTKWDELAKANQDGVDFLKSQLE